MSNTAPTAYCSVTHRFRITRYEAEPYSAARQPDRVTTDGHGSYSRATRTVLGKTVRHRTSAFLNNRLEQDHRGIKGRIRCMQGFKSPGAAARFCREHGELRNLLRPRRRHNQVVSASLRRSRFSKTAELALRIMQNA